MNNYHNPYRNPYPGQGAGRFGSPEESPSKDPGTQASENRQAEAGQQSSASQEQGAPPPSQGNAGWQSDPSLKNMDLKNLAFLSELVAESGNKSLDTLLPFLISANKNANAMGLQFNDAETGLLLEVLKKHMSPEEQARVDMLRKMADMLGKK